jgi:hypothetical protein
VAESGEPVATPPGWELVRDARYGAAWVGFLSLAADWPATPPTTYHEW